MKKETIMLVTLLLILSGCLNTDSEKTSYYFPNGFKGNYVVIYGDINGCPKDYENGRRKLVIPESGILITQFEFSDGFRNDAFFIEQGNGHPLRIDENDSLPIAFSNDSGTANASNYKNKITVMRGARIEFTDKLKQVKVLESGSLVYGNDISTLGKEMGNFIDYILQMVEKDSMKASCR